MNDTNPFLQRANTGFNNIGFYLSNKFLAQANLSSEQFNSGYLFISFGKMPCIEWMKSWYTLCPGFKSYSWISFGSHVLTQRNLMIHFLDGMSLSSWFTDFMEI